MDKKMRKAYKNRDPFLTKERISLLNQLGIAWEVKRKPSWDDYYNIASEFYKKYGHVNIPYSYVTEEGYMLGRWIYKVKMPYKSFVSVLTEDQKRRLELIDIYHD